MTSDGEESQESSKQTTEMDLDAWIRRGPNVRHRIGIPDIHREVFVGHVVAGRDITIGRARPYVSTGKFEVYEDRVGEFRFRLKARNGRVVAVSEAYSSKSAAREGCKEVQRAAKGAAVVDAEA